MHEKWTEKEVEKLKKNYKKKSIDELTKLFPNRCDSGIKNKVRKLGLRK